MGKKTCYRYLKWKNKTLLDLLLKILTTEQNLIFSWKFRFKCTSIHFCANVNDHFTHRMQQKTHINITSCTFISWRWTSVHLSIGHALVPMELLQSYDAMLVLLLLAAHFVTCNRQNTMATISATTTSGENQQRIFSQSLSTIWSLRSQYKIHKKHTHTCISRAKPMKCD